MELEFHELDRRYEGLRRRSPAREERLLSSLARHGQQVPIIVVAGGERRPVVDGFKRLRALEALKQDVVLATEWTLSEPEALVLEWQMRDGEGSDALEQAWLLRELRDRFDLTEAELASQCDRSQSWVSRRLSLLQDLPEEIQEQVRAGSLGAHAAMKYLVPMARAMRQECLQLCAALAPRKPTSRQVEALYTAVLSSGDEARALVLQNPWLFLRAQAEARRAEQKERTPAQLLLGDFGALGGVARRLHKRLRQGEHERLSAAERTEVAQGFLTARAETHALLARCEKEFGHAG